MQSIVHKLLCMQISMRLTQAKNSGGYRRKLLFRNKKICLFERLKCNFDPPILLNLQVMFVHLK